MRQHKGASDHRAAKAPGFFSVLLTSPARLCNLPRHILVLENVVAGTDTAKSSD